MDKERKGQDGRGNIWRSEFAQSRPRQCNGGLGRWSNASGDPEACDAKSSLPGLGGRVLIGGWARAARQGSKLWEAQVEPPVDPGTSDHPAYHSTVMHLLHHGTHAQHATWCSCEPRCQVSFPLPFPIEFSSPRLNSSIHNTVQPVGWTSPPRFPTAPILACLPRPAAFLLKSETNATQILPTQTKYPANHPIQHSPRRVFVHQNSPLFLL